MFKKIANTLFWRAEWFRILMLTLLAADAMAIVAWLIYGLQNLWKEDDPYEDLQFLLGLGWDHRRDRRSADCALRLRPLVSPRGQQRRVKLASVFFERADLGWDRRDFHFKQCSAIFLCAFCPKANAIRIPILCILFARKRLTYRPGYAIL